MKLIKYTSKANDHFQTFMWQIHINSGEINLDRKRSLVNAKLTKQHKEQKAIKLTLAHFIKLSNFFKGILTKKIIGMFIKY